jgi:hypothetical protein
LYTLIETAKLNGVDPEAWLADVIARIADHPINLNPGADLRYFALIAASSIVLQGYTPARHRDETLFAPF